MIINRTKRNLKRVNRVAHSHTNPWETLWVAPYRNGAEGMEMTVKNGMALYDMTDDSQLRYRENTTEARTVTFYGSDLWTNAKGMLFVPVQFHDDSTTALIMVT